MAIKTEIENKVTLKLFVGCPISSEMRLMLNQSLNWKQSKIDASKNDLVETHFHNKDYIGLFLKKDTLNLSEIKEIETKVNNSLKTYLPLFGGEKIKLLVFSQVFIS